MKFSELVNQKNIKKSFVHIENYGVRAFFHKAKTKIFGMKDSAACSVVSRSQDFLMIDSKEEKLAKTYIESVVKDPDTFVDLINPDDEMYIFTRDNMAQKETASYHYFEVGRECFKSIEHIMDSGGKSFEGIRSFLDFASGYGRVTRFLIQAVEQGKVWVSDIYRGAVDFQKKYFRVNGFYSENDPSKLQFPERFEIIYVGSLFSHLPANRFRDWLSRLYEVVEDDGMLIFSTHGEWLRPEGVQMGPSGCSFFGQSESRSLSTDEYGCTYVTREWVESLADELGINHIYFLERGLCEHQDIYIATKMDFPSLNNLETENYTKGSIDAVHMSPDGGIHILGWAIDKASGAPVREVFLFMNREMLGSAVLGLQRPDVAEHFKRSDCLNSGWEYRGSGSLLRNVMSTGGAKFIVIKALIKNHKGDVTCLVSAYEGIQ